MSLVLNGSSQYAWRNAPVADAAPFTVAAWFKSTTDSALQAIWGEAYQADTYDYWRLSCRGNVAGDPLGIYIRRTGAADAVTSSGYTANQWHHAMFIEAGAQDHKIYIDGGSEGSDTTNSQSPINIDKMSIGALPYNSGWVNHFAGKIAEVAIWDIALSPTDRASLAAGADPSTIQPGNLIAYWPLYDDANDDGGSNLHLTPVDSPSFDTSDHPAIDINLIGSVPAVCTTIGDMDVTTCFAGETTAACVTTGLITSSFSLAGEVDAACTTTSALRVSYLVGSVSSSCVTIGLIISSLSLAGEIDAAIAVTQGAATHITTLVGSVDAAVAVAQGGIKLTYLSSEQSPIKGEPIELYCFNEGTTFWTQTSSNLEVIYDTRTYIPVLLRRSDIDASINSLKNLVHIEVDRNNLFAVNYIHNPIDGIVALTIYRGHDSDYVPHWKGTVLSVQFKHKTAIITVGQKTSSLKRTGLMRKYSVSCGYPLYSARCTILKSSYKVEGTIASVSGAALSSPSFGSRIDTWFKGGIFESGDHSQMIVYHVGNNIRLAHKIPSLSVGDFFSAYAGCDHTQSTCKVKFQNKLNFGGQPYIPNKNPFVGDSIVY